VGLVPLLLVLHEGSPAPGDHGPAPRAVRWAPWATGTVFASILFTWITRLPAHAMTQPWLIWPGLLLLGLYLGLYVALFGWLVRLLRRRLGLSIFLTAPIAWSASEWLKSSGELGFPWGNLGSALAVHPAWIQLAAVVGSPGLSLWVVGVNAFLAAAIAAWMSRRFVDASLRLVLGAALLILPPLWGSARLRAADRTTEAAGAGAPSLGRVALIQPNIASDQKWNPAAQESVVARLYGLTRRAAADSIRPQLIVWPETALPFYVRLEPAKLTRLLGTARELGTPILAGYPDARLVSSGDVTTHNAAGLILPTGAIAGQYEKIHLVPFGERIPFQGIFPFLGSFDLGQAEWTPGAERILLSGAGAPFGVLICFESIFPDHARAYRNEGAQYLVNVTNDEWFGRSAGPVQHADLAILRAVELGVGLVRAANTGISMIIDPYGRVLASTGLFEEAVLIGEIPAPIGATRFARWGDWTTVASLAIIVLLLATAWFRPVGRRAEPLTDLRASGAPTGD
jgi:apolipoprotein N-acyltransferase